MTDSEQRRQRPFRRYLLYFGLAMLGTSIMVYLLQPSWYLRMRHPLEYQTYVLAHAHNYDLPPALVAAVIEEESGFDTKAESKAGAVGLMQLTPDTARGIAQRTGGAAFRERDLRNPEINIRYGCWYLRHLHDKYKGHGDRDYTLTLAAYNAGQGKVNDWLHAQRDGTLSLEEIPYRETRNYVMDVRNTRRAYQRGYSVLSK